jgi:YidC/Oxa1 family membrane protein insertase
MNNIFNTLLIQPITNILVAIYQLLQYFHIPSALGFSIILLTIIIRLILYPVIASQMKASKKMQAVQPHVKRLKEKHKGDAQQLQAATMALYKEFGINPVAGCLPLFIQLPVIWGLYAVLNQTVKQTSFQAVNKLVYSDSLKLNHLWDTHFFGLALSQPISQHIKTVGPLILLVPVLTAVLQYFQTKMMLPPKDLTPKTDKKDSKDADFASAFQTQSLYVFPLMIGFFSYSLPFGLSLYWNTFTIFGIIQQYLMKQSVPQVRTVDEQPAVAVKKLDKPAVKAKKKKKK